MNACGGSVAQILNDAGADVGAKNGDGGTALHGACKRGDFVRVKVLLPAGADPSCCPERELPLGLASRAGSHRSGSRCEGPGRAGGGQRTTTLSCAAESNAMGVISGLAGVDIDGSQSRCTSAAKGKSHTHSARPERTCIAWRGRRHCSKWLHERWVFRSVGDCSVPVSTQGEGVP
jgi:hypothetical protein